MKKKVTIGIFIWIFIVLMSLMNYAQAREIINYGEFYDNNGVLKQGIDDSIVDPIIELSGNLVLSGSRIEGQRFDGLAGNLFVNEKINLYVNTNGGRELVFGVVTEDNEIKSFQDGGLDYNTFDMYTDENTINIVLNSENPVGAFQQALLDKRIDYSAVGFRKKIKFGFVFFFANWFFDDLCEEIDLYVDSDSINDEADGTIAGPFNKVKDALDYGNDLGCDEINIYVDKGEYLEDRLDIATNTKVSGYDMVTRSNDVVASEIVLYDAYFVNSGAYKFELKNLVISGNEEKITEAGVSVNNENAETEIENVIIENALDFGIKQLGGRIEIDDVSITGTNPRMMLLGFYGGGEVYSVKYSVDSGTGIFLGGGVEAFLRNISLVANDNGALRVDGRGTRVYSDNLYVYNNEADDERFREDPRPEIGIGAVESRNRALLLLENSVIQNNRYAGISVVESGRAHFRNTNVFDTGKILNPYEVDGQEYGGGNNIVVRQTSENIAEGVPELEFHKARIEGAELSALALSDGLIKMSIVNITKNNIGLNIVSSANIGEFNEDCVDDEVYIFNNRMDVARKEIVPPDVNELIGSNEEPVEGEALCADVPFRCRWC